MLAAGTWCVYEQFKANELGIRVIMILPKDQRESITAELRKGVVGFQVIAQSLTNIKVEDSRPLSRQMVCALVFQRDCL